MAKGQFYLFTAVILITAVFIAVANNSAVSFQKTQDIENMMNNFLYEGTMVINHAIYNNQNITMALSNYTESFIAYADTKNIELGILVLYNRGGNTHIVNYLKEPVLISGNTVGHLQTTYNQQNPLLVNYRNITYTYAFPEERTELKTLMIENG